MTIYFGVLSTSILSYVIGYDNVLKWNNNSVNASCLIIGYIFEPLRCSYVYGDWPGDVTCVNGKVVYEYGNITYAKSEMTGNKEFVIDYLANNFPKGLVRQCWYQKDNPHDLKFKITDQNIGRNLSIAIGAGGSGGLIIYFLIECIVYYIWRGRYHLVD